MTDFSYFGGCDVDFDGKVYILTWWRTVWSYDVLYVIYFDVVTYFPNFLTSLIEPRSGCETIVLRLCVCVCVCVYVCVCVSVCPSAMTLRCHNIVNSQCIATQLHTKVDTIDIWHSPSTGTTAFATTLYVSPKSSKCNISITNCPIALKFDTGVKHQKVHVND